MQQLQEDVAKVLVQICPTMQRADSEEMAVWSALNNMVRIRLTKTC